MLRRTAGSRPRWRTSVASGASHHDLGPTDSGAKRALGRDWHPPDESLPGGARSVHWWVPWAVGAGALVAEVVLFFILAHLDRTIPIAHDNLSHALPQRALLSSGLRDGFVPLWDPYSGGGVAVFSIYMSADASPLVWVIALLRSYDLSSFVLEILSLNAIAAIGMYLLLRKRGCRWVATAAAAAFALTPFMVLQSQLNIEAAGTAAAIPWIVLGVTRIAASEAVGVPLLAGGLGLALTSGYLGLTLLTCEFLLISGIAWLIARYVQCRMADLASPLPPVRSLARRAGYVAAAVGFVACMLGLAIAETFANLSLGDFTDRAVDPFVGSLQPGSLTTLVNLASVNPYASSFGNHVTILFVPTVFLIGLVFGLRRPTPFFLAAAGTAVLVFVASLPGNYTVTRFLVSAIPGMDTIRFHSWLSILIVFLAITAGADGLRAPRSEVRFAATAVMAVGCALAVVYVVVGEMQDQSVPSAVVGVGCIILVSAFLALLTRPLSIFPRRALGAGIVLITVTQLTIANTQVVNPYLGAFNKAQASAIQDTIDAAPDGFPTPPTFRRLQAPEPPNGLVPNLHSYQRVPVVESYMPQRHPAITRLLDAGRAQPLRSYALTSSLVPLRYSLVGLTPNSLLLRLHRGTPTRHVVLSVPFSPNWVARVDGKATTTRRSLDGLLAIGRVRGGSEITLEYSPWYAWPLGLLALGAWLVVLGWVPLSRLAQRLRRDGTLHVGSRS